MQTAPHEIVALAAKAVGRVISAAWLVFRPGTEFGGLGYLTGPKSLPAAPWKREFGSGH